MIAEALAQARSTKEIPSQGAGEDTGLVRTLGFWDVLGFGLGITIGGGIFVQTGHAATEAGPAVVLSFLLAAISCAGTGLCYAELSGIIPSVGSSYSFSYVAVGELAACIVGIMNVAGNILSAAAVARGWAGYLAGMLEEMSLGLPTWISDFEWHDMVVSPMAMLLVFALGALNMLGAKEAATVNAIVTALSVALLMAFTVVGATKVDADRWHPFLPTGLPGVARAAGMVFFAYLGFDMLACLSVEAKGSTTVPRGIVWTLVLSTAVYVATATVFTGMVARGDINNEAPLAQAARDNGLEWIATFVYIGAVGNMLTTVMGSIVAAPRIVLAMAQDGLLPELLGRTASGIPHAALVITVLPSVVLAGFFDFQELADIVEGGALCTFSLVCASLLTLRFKEAGTDYSGVPAPSSKFEVARQDSGDSTTVSPVAADVIGAADDGVGVASESALKTMEASQAFVHSEVRTYSLPPRLFLFAMCSSLLSAAMEVSAAHRQQLPWLVALPAVLFATLGCLAVSITIAFRPYRRMAAFRRREQKALGTDGESKEFRTPLLPVLPLFGIFMNMLLFSQIPLLALGRMLLVFTACSGFYFSYSAHHSHLRVVDDSIG